MGNGSRFGVEIYVSGPDLELRGRHREGQKIEKWSDNFASLDLFVLRYKWNSDQLPLTVQFSYNFDNFGVLKN